MIIGLKFKMIGLREESLKRLAVMNKLDDRFAQLRLRVIQRDEERSYSDIKRTNDDLRDILK